MSGHVGDRLSALVDGELDHDNRDHVLAHVACCSQCKQALEAERQVHDLLGSLRTEERAPAPSGDMISGLLRLGADAEPGHVRAGPGSGPLPAAGRRPGRRQPSAGMASSLTPGPSTRPPRHSHQSHQAGTPLSGAVAYAISRPSPGRRFALGVAGAASAFGMTAALAFTLNGAPTTGPHVKLNPPTQHMGVEDAKIMPDYPAPESGVLSDMVEPPGGSGGDSVPGAPAGIQVYSR